MNLNLKTKRKWKRAGGELGRGAVVLFCALAMALPCLAQGDVDPRGVARSEINETPAFLVRVDVDRPNRVYREGDAIQVTVRSERAGYLYLFYCDAGQRVTCLFPNRVQRDCYIPAGQSVVIPDERAAFRLRVGPPFGDEVLKAVVATQPLKALELEALTKGSWTPLAAKKLKAVFVEVRGDEAEVDPSSPETVPPPQDNRAKPRRWAEHHVQLSTVGRAAAVPERPALAEMPQLEGVVARADEARDPRPPPASSRKPDGPRRVGVFIGVSEYQDPAIRPLRVAHHDAAALAAAMKRYGRLDETVVLVNQRATLRNIRYVVQEGLPAATSPGDLVILYWSGHGGRTANLDGTEPDGYDEYLVPHDGRLEGADAIRTTMLLDKTFGRWVQGLDGRKLIVIIDACHSGGQSQGAIKSLAGGDLATPFRKFFFATQWTRTKDIGQRETAVLASSRATQISLERRSGDLSVMTYFLIEKLGSGSGPVTLPEAVDYLETAVPAFIEKHFPGTTQTPVFVNQTTPPVYLRP